MIEESGSHAGGDGGDAPGSLPEGVVDDLLQDEQRRQILTYLAGREEPVVVEDLAKHVAGSDDLPADSDGDEVRTVRDTIYDEHLPKLTAIEVVSYDSMVGTVEPSSQWRSVRDRLEDTE